MIKCTEVDSRRISFVASDLVEIRASGHHFEQLGQAETGGFELGGSRLSCRLAQSAHQDCAAVGDLGYDDSASDEGGGIFAVGPAVLLPAEQDIAVYASLNPCEELAMFSQKSQSDVILSAVTHEERTTAHLSETHDTAEGVHRYAQFGFLLHPDGDSFTVLREIGALSGYVKSVQQLFHIVASMSRRADLM